MALAPLSPAAEHALLDARLTAVDPLLLGTILNGRALGAHLAIIALAVLDTQLGLR